MSIAILAAIFFTFTSSLSTYAEDVNASSCDYDKSITGFSSEKKTSGILIQALQSNCLEMMDTILKKENENDLFKAAPAFATIITSQFHAGLESLKNAYEGEPGTDEIIQAFQTKVSIINKFFSFVKEKCPDGKQTTPACEARKLNTTIAASMEASRSRILAEEKAKEEAQKKQAVKNDPERIFKLKFCKNPNLFGVLYVAPKPIESNCIYSLLGPSARLFVIQSIDGGILVGQPSSMLLNKIIFVKTKKQYADGDLIQDQFVRSTGLKKYKNTLGAQKTVNSFQYLGDGERVDEDGEL